MKILRLDLLKFGPFEDLSLPLDGGDHGLHVVYGPNEAGKSSALRALRQALYGIPHNSTDNFIHHHQDMRIGLVLRSRSGEVLECIRRKGRSNTLRGPDDIETVELGRLAAMLGGLDEPSFATRFGIDYQALVSGGCAMVQGRGDLGEILFAAGSGIADLRKVQQRLADQADELFKPRGSVQKINKALSEYNQANQDIKAALLPTAEWDKHRQALDDATRRKKVVDAELVAKSAERARLERILKAQPLLARRVQVHQELAQVAGAPILPDDFSEARRTAVTGLQAAENAERDAARQIEELTRKIDELQVPEALLAHRAAIDGLFTDLGSHQKAARDRPGLLKQQELLEAEAEALLRDLGRGPDLQDAAELRLSRAERLRIQNLANDQRALERRHASAAQSAEKLRQEIEQTRLRLDEHDSPPDTDELKRAIDRACKGGDLESRWAEERTELEQLEKQAAIDLGKLRLWQGTLEELETLAVPELETIERFDRELREGAGEIKSLQQRGSDCGDNLRRLDQRLDRLRREQDVPTEEDLAAARQQRDAAWRLVQRAWQQSPADPQEVAALVAEFSPGGDLAAAFEASVARADQIADRLRREATRVAEKAGLAADRLDTQRRLEALTAELDARQQRHHGVEQAWLDLWKPLGIDPQSPPEMRSWVARHAALATAAETIRKKWAGMQELEKVQQSHRSELRRCLNEIGLAPTTSESLAALVQQGADVVRRSEEGRNSRLSQQRELDRLERELRDAEREVREAAEAVGQWREQWGQSVRQLGLSPDAAPAEVNGVIETIDELLSKTKDADDKRLRIQGIDRDAEHFAASVRRLADLVAGELSGVPVEEAAAALHGRLREAENAQARRDELVQQRAREEKKLAETRTDIRGLKAAIETMCREAGCQAADELPAVEQKSRRLQSLTSDLRQLEGSLAELAAGAALDAFCEEVAAIHADELQPQIRRLGEAMAELERERDELQLTIGSERTCLRQMDGSSRAAQAREDAENLLASITSAAQQYARLRLASVVLRQSIDRYRERNQGPVLARASELFAELTLGSFVGLRADDSDGEEVLKGVRPGGNLVGVEGMSDGTCDQLYLALRLASIETYLADREPIPFIVDDILIKFDDERSAAALRALVRLSRRTQVIFFTHHGHLVDLARESVEASMLFVQELSQPALDIGEIVTRPYAPSASALPEGIAAPSTKQAADRRRQ